MQLKGNFKNPDELESDEFDELLADEEEMEQQASDIEVDSDSDVVWCDDDEVGESGNGDANNSDSESIDASDCSDDEDDSVSMSASSEDDIAEEKPKPGKRTQGTQTQDDNETPCSSTSANARKTKTKENSTANAGAASSDGNEASGGLVDYNVDEEEDETIRAMIAAIKKPRSVPPPIDMEDFISNICFHITEDIVAVGTITGDVALYRYANEGNTLLRNIEVHAKAVRDIQFTMDGRDMLTCSKDKCIMVTDMETEKLKRFYETAHDDAINKLYVIDESIFATGDDDGIVKLWDLRCKDPIFSLREVEDYISQILTNENRKLLLLTSGDGYLTTINIGSRKLYVQSEPYEEELTCMGVYRGESKLVAGTSKGRLYTYNWGQFGYHCDMYPGIKTPISHMIPITDRICCVAGEEGVIRAVHIAPYKNLGVVGQHNMPIEAMDVNWSGEIIASSSHNNDVRFWNVKYFEDFGEVKYNEKHNNYKDRRHNLPSSRVKNAGDFFADLNNAANDDE